MLRSPAHLCESDTIIDFIPRFVKTGELMQKESLGEIMFVRARYGHGDRVGYDREWRADRDGLLPRKTCSRVFLRRQNHWVMEIFSTTSGELSRQYTGMVRKEVTPTMESESAIKSLEREALGSVSRHGGGGGISPGLYSFRPSAAIFRKRQLQSVSRVAPDRL